MTRYVRELHSFTLGGREHWVVVPYCRWKPWHWWKRKFTLPTPSARSETFHRERSSV